MARGACRTAAAAVPAEAMRVRRGDAGEDVRAWAHSYGGWFSFEEQLGTGERFAQEGNAKYTANLAISQRLAATKSQISFHRHSFWHRGSDMAIVRPWRARIAMRTPFAP